MGLLPGRFTPRVQEALTRLGSKLPYREAAAEVEAFWGVQVSAATVQRQTGLHGATAVALEADQVAQLQAGAAPPMAGPERLALSVDGALVQLTTGEWREVKMLSLGRFDPQWHAGRRQVETRLSEVSYFARLAPAAAFEEQSLAEWHRRGGSQARRVVALADGALWIQSLIDYHRPDAIRVLDFAHAAGYLGAVARAVYGEGTPAAQAWFQAARRRLLYKPPQQTLRQLAFLRQQQADDSAAAETIEVAFHYLNRRQTMIDYPHFRRCGYPVGSGSVESAHKVVMQRRMKQAGMRWRAENVNPMLALRLLSCNGRWSDGWAAIAAECRRQRRQRRLARALLPLPPSALPLTLSSVAVGPAPAAPNPPERTGPWKPAPDHPWRLSLWPAPRSRSSCAPN